MRQIVIDASVAVSWCFADEESSYARRILDDLRTAEAVVPSIWPLEVANALLTAERRKRLKEADSVRFLDLIGALQISVDGQGGMRTLTETITLARKHGLTSYDSAYLELALRLGAPLATLDRDLRKAAAKLTGLAGESGA